MGETILIKCFQCRKRFPFNPEKHKHDSYIYCPHCGSPIENEYKQRLLPQFSLKWIRKRLAERKQKNEARKILQRYFGTPIMDATGRIVDWNLSFSMSKWMKGQRPTLTVRDVIEAVGDNPQTVADEIERLEKLGIKVKEE